MSEPMIQLFGKQLRVTVVGAKKHKEVKTALDTLLREKVITSYILTRD